MLHHTLRAALAATALIAAQAAPAGATITSRDENAAVPRGWSAVQGMDPRAVRDMARDLPTSDQAAVDQPWCAPDAEIETSLRHDFEEERVASNGRDTALWGSALMGTWTVVLERPDATSCVIASGIGFRDGTSPDAYFTRVGLLR
ncbi:hypothetical protein [Paracoccus yeei]|jgi:hypothetical protein|uniref:hypothetical protein n=1 Tax=Paracoccus yeei TaxID=147645 RepID=UPI003BF8533D